MEDLTILENAEARAICGGLTLTQLTAVRHALLTTFGTLDHMKWFAILGKIKFVPGPDPLP